MSIKSDKKIQKTLIENSLSINFPNYKNKFTPNANGTLGGSIEVLNKEKVFVSMSVGAFNIHRINTNHGNIRHVNKAIGINTLDFSCVNKFKSIIDYFNTSEYIGDVFGNILTVESNIMYKYQKNKSLYLIDSYSSLQSFSSKLFRNFMQSNFRNTFKIKNDGKIVPVPALVLIECYNKSQFLVAYNIDDKKMYLIKNESLSFEETFNCNDELNIENDSSIFVDSLIDDFIKNYMKVDDPIRQELIRLPRNALIDKISVLNMYFS